MAGPEDEELHGLMLRYQRGDADAVRELYARTAPAIRRYLARWCEWARTEDLTQETFLQIHRARRTFMPDLPLLPWMYAIARHVGLQYVRAKGRRITEQQGAETFMHAVPDPAGNSFAERHDLERAMSVLTTEQSEIVWMADVQGFSASEIAAITGSTAGAVRVRLHRTHQKLRLILSDEQENSG